MSIYKCKKCNNTDPCILAFKTSGDVRPTICPFDTRVKATAEWILSIQKNNSK
jgi:hypothetical protein